MDEVVLGIQPTSSDVAGGRMPDELVAIDRFVRPIADPLGAIGSQCPC